MTEKQLENKTNLQELINKYIQVGVDRPSSPRFDRGIVWVKDDMYHVLLIKAITRDGKSWLNSKFQSYPPEKYEEAVSYFKSRI